FLKQESDCALFRLPSSLLLPEILLATTKQPCPCCQTMAPCICCMEERPPVKRRRTTTEQKSGKAKRWRVVPGGKLANWYAPVCRVFLSTTSCWWIQSAINCTLLQTVLIHDSKRQAVSLFRWM